VVLANDGSPPFKPAAEAEIHCVSSYIDCQALKACMASAESGEQETGCIGEQLSRLAVEEGFGVISHDDTPTLIEIEGLADGSKQTFTLTGSQFLGVEVLSAPNNPLVLEGKGNGFNLVVGSGAVIDPVTKTVHALGVRGLEAEAAEGDAGAEDDAGVEEVPAAAVAEAPAPAEKPRKAAPKVDTGQFPDADTMEEKRPFSKGDMEIGLGLGLAGDGSASYLGVGGKYAYYVIDKLAPGLDLQYTHIFVDESLGHDYPDSLTLLPFLKYVITQKMVAPYVFVKGGYDIEWGTDWAVNAWVLGLGGGVHVGVGKHFTINIELSALHYWYSGTKQYWYDDDDLLGVRDGGGQKVFKSDCESSPNCNATPEDNPAAPDGTWILRDSEGNNYICTDEALCSTDTVRDKKDVTREWFFPLVTIGMGFFF
jgi:hypothetical protein